MRIAGERLGRDAVVLSTRPVRTEDFWDFFRKTVLLVSAGVLEEEKREGDESKRERMMAFQKLLEARKALSESAVSQTPIPATAGTSEPLPPPASTDDGDTLRLSREGLALATSTSRKAYESLSGGPAPSKLEHEVSELSRRLSEVIRHIEEERESPPDHDGTAGNSPLLAKLLGMEVSPQRARTLVERYARENDGRTFPEWLAARVKATGTTPADSLGGRRVMFVGPTESKDHDDRETRGDQRALGTPESFAPYGRYLQDSRRRTASDLRENPEFPWKSFSNLKPLTRSLRSSRCGSRPFGHRRTKPEGHERVDELSSLYGAFRPDAVNLLIAANRNIAICSKSSGRPASFPDKFPLPKIDETSTYGALLDIVEDFDRPVSFLTTGQNVPNDIEVASGVRFADLLLMPGNIGDG